MPWATVTLWFAGRFDPDKIAALLGITPITTHRVNEVLRPGIVAKEDLWGSRLAEEDPVRGSDVDDLLETALGIVESMVTQIAAVCAPPEVIGTLSLALYIPPNEYIPAIELRATWCQLLGRAGLRFVVDGMLLGPDEPLSDADLLN